MLCLTEDEFNVVLNRIRQFKDSLLAQFPNHSSLISTLLEDIEGNIFRASRVTGLFERRLKIPHNYLLFNYGTDYRDTVKEMARGLAEAVCGSPNDLLYFEMSDYRESHPPIPAPLPEWSRGLNAKDERLQAYEKEVGKRRSANVHDRLWDSPPGFEGSEAGEISEPLIQNPRRVILLLGLENALDGIRDSFGAPLAEGNTLSGSRRELDFSQCIILMTTSLESPRGVYDKLTTWFADRINKMISCSEPTKIWRHFPQTRLSSRMFAKGVVD